MSWCAAKILEIERIILFFSQKHEKSKKQINKKKLVDLVSRDNLLIKCLFLDFDLSLIS